MFNVARELKSTQREAIRIRQKHRNTCGLEPYRERGARSRQRISMSGATVGEGTLTTSGCWMELGANMNGPGF